MEALSFICAEGEDRNGISFMRSGDNLYRHLCGIFFCFLDGNDGRGFLIRGVDPLWTERNRIDCGRYSAAISAAGSGLYYADELVLPAKRCLISSGKGSRLPVWNEKAIFDAKGGTVPCDTWDHHYWQRNGKLYQSYTALRIFKNILITAPALYTFGKVVNKTAGIFPAKARIGDRPAINAFADFLAAFLNITFYHNSFYQVMDVRV